MRNVFLIIVFNFNVICQTPNTFRNLNSNQNSKYLWKHNKNLFGNSFRVTAENKKPFLVSLLYHGYLERRDWYIVYHSVCPSSELAPLVSFSASECVSPSPPPPLWSWGGHGHTRGGSKFGRPARNSGTLSTLHCKDTSQKIQNKYSHKRNCAASVPISTFMCLWAIFTYSHDQSAYSAAGKYVDRS
jgi:hypothetical protein